ncbi:thioredoxin domain-containing protein [uncultured Thermanaerothrix sp.]|uniref:DsbA family protein n=1 Tax=uncultured Thermanaerothrix sp. TaxID=1195149 RepID=UPI00261A1C12|nr:thioredoxin domain-containing protein [uncultured Thermanaerothrix sp.]
MFCIIAFIVLSILGIFSASNRQLAKEALDCVLRRVTLRPCTTGFDEKMKAKILGYVITRSETGARFLNRYFEPLSWIFFFLLVGSTFFAARGVFLYYTTGSCNGLNQSGFCVFDPTGQNTQFSSVDESCPVTSGGDVVLTLEGVNLSGFPRLTGGANAKPIVFIGSYGCDYSRKAYPMIRRLVQRYGAELIFLYYPVKEHSDYLAKVGYCAYKLDPQRFWDLNDRLFAADKSRLEDEAFVQGVLEESGFNAQSVQFCAKDFQTEWVVKQQLAEVRKTNFYGTPTVFIQNEALIGPKPYRVYAIALEGLLYWLK